MPDNPNTDACGAVVIYRQSSYEARYECHLIPGHEGWHSDGYGLMWPVLDVQQAS